MKPFNTCPYCNSSLCLQPDALRNYYEDMLNCSNQHCSIKFSQKISFDYNDKFHKGESKLSCYLFHVNDLSVAIFVNPHSCWIRTKDRLKPLFAESGDFGPFDFVDLDRLANRVKMIVNFS